MDGESTSTSNDTTTTTGHITFTLFDRNILILLCMLVVFLAIAFGVGASVYVVKAKKFAADTQSGAAVSATPSNIINDPDFDEDDASWHGEGAAPSETTALVGGARRADNVL